MRKKLFTFLLALVASVGMMNAKVTWDSSNISGFYVMGSNGSYSKEGVTLSANAEYVNAQWQSSTDDISFTTNETGGFTFSNTLDKNFTKIEMTLEYLGAWYYANLGSGWSSSDGDYLMNEPSTVTWTGNASTVDLLKDEYEFDGDNVKSIVFYFEGDETDGPATYILRILADPEKGSVALQNPSSDIVLNYDGTYNVPENAEVTILATPLEGYEFSGWRVGDYRDMCYYDFCGGDALNTNDNPLTVTMTADVAYVADFAAATPQTPVIGDSNDATTIETFLSTNDGTEIAELTIDRPVLNNMYNTLCLPFDMDAARIAASSLNGVEIYELNSVEVVNDELFFGLSDAVNAVVAGRPYIVKYSAASQLDDLDFENVTIDNADLTDQAVTMNGVTFKGTFTPFVMGSQTGFDTNGGYLFLGQNNVLYWPNTNNPLKPFRAYFYIDLNSGLGKAPLHYGMPARIGRPASTPTGVENVQGTEINAKKVIRDGQLIIMRNGVEYNANGQNIK